MRKLLLILGLISSVAHGAKPDAGPGESHLLRDQGEVGLLLTTPAWTRYTGRYDREGKYRSVFERYSTSVYGLAGSVGIVDGLQVGFGLPLVQTVVGAAGDPEKSRFGMGDMTAHMAGELRLERIDVGARVTYKAASGGTDQDLINPSWPLGTGQSDLDTSVHLFRNAGTLAVSGTIGFTKRFVGPMPSATQDIEYEPGNVLHLEAGLVNWVNGQYGAGLSGLFHTMEAARHDTGDGLVAVGEGSAAASIAASFTVRAAEWLHVELDTRTPGIGHGLSVVDTGAILWGRNVRSTTFPPLMFSVLVEI